MMNTGKYLPSNLSMIQKLQTLIIGRLMTVFLIMVASWVWSSGNLKLSYENFPQGLFLVFLIAVGLTIVYFFILRLSDHYRWQIRTQFLLDALLITWLVWRTGDLTSPYLTLYIILISVASIFMSARGTIFIASLCVFLFALIAALTSLDVITSYGRNLEVTRAIQIIGFHAVAFFVVGLLSSRLAERYVSGEKLKETTKTLANLRVLHERIVESIGSGLITIDLEGNIYTFNKAAEEITGYAAKDVRGTSVYLLLGEIGREIGDSLKAHENHETQPRYEISFTTPDGFNVQLGYGISPLFTETGEKTGLIITFQDLTDIRSMEESVRRKDRLAAVGRVAAGLAHEIRNPLGAMRGAIQVLESQTEKNSAQASLMDIILCESDRLNQIISNFLKYARPQTTNFADIDVKEAIEDTVTLLQHSPDIKPFHRLETDLPDQPVVVSADVSQLKQIFWNLARNAIQAMNAGGNLNIRLRRLQNNRIRIVFEDTGCGMPREQVERLFEPFSKSTTGGTGLGLSIVYQIIRDHNGTINVSSKENDGTRITIEIPTDYARKGPPEEIKQTEFQTNGSRLESLLNIKAGEKTMHQ
jgi:two-component system, NtrC family, sensor histidine kinase PilS